MDVCGRHIDVVGDEGVVEESALRVEPVVVAFAEVDADGDLQAGPSNQRGGVARPARGGAAFVNPLLDLLLGVVGHVLGLALGQAAFAHEPVGEFEIGPAQVRDRRVKDQNVHSHQWYLLLLSGLSASRLRMCRWRAGRN